MRKTLHKNQKLTAALKERLLAWASRYEEVAWLDSNHYLQNHGRYQAILAVDAFTAIKTDCRNAFKELNEYQQVTNDWLFGYLSYDLKNDVEHLSSDNFDGLHFPDLYFFQPKKVFLFTDSEVELQYLNLVDDELESDWEEILSTKISTISASGDIKISLRTTKDAYFEKVAQLKSHIDRGDVYEANFCQEFYANNATIDPIQVFHSLNAISKPPFATFLKLQQHYVLSASPERYLKKEGAVLLSQPIKGTARRMERYQDDLQMVQSLKADPKERSENIMITDLVRNDLSRIAKKGSVLVEELCEVYTFEQVHQLISTIRCLANDGISPTEILEKTFPMGSMTGAPKIRAMQLIEALEDTRRGVYSGAIGYFGPNGDFDFNVVIRSILYNEARKYVSFSVGSAITAKSVIANEYEECLIKAKAMRQVLS